MDTEQEQPDDSKEEVASPGYEFSAEDLVISAEMTKTAARQTAKGMSLTLVVHPDESLPWLQLPIGQRLMVSALPIGDDENPEVPIAMAEAVKARQGAAVMAKDTDFQAWLVESGNIGELSETLAADWIRESCGIKSRADFPKNPGAVTIWTNIVNEFRNREEEPSWL